MPILPTLRGPADLRDLTESELDRARGRDPRHDHRHRRDDRRPPRQQPGRRRAHDRPPSAPRFAARPDRLGHGPPGLSPQAPDGPLRAVRDAPPAGRDRRVPAAERVRARRLRRGSRRDRPLDRPGPRDGPRSPPRAGADRGRRRRRGDHERAEPGGAERHRPAKDPAADRPQRQRDVDQPDGGGLSKYLSQIKLSGTWQSSKTRL